MASTQRLDWLRTLATNIQAEIDREIATLERLRAVERSAMTALHRGGWNQRAFAATCEQFGVEPDAVVDGSKTQSASDARHVFMWLMRSTGASYKSIGDELDMDHTSAIYGVKRVEREDGLLAVAREVFDALAGSEEVA